MDHCTLSNYLFLFFFFEEDRVGPTLSSAHSGLTPGTYSGITPDRPWGTICGGRDRIRLNHMKVKCPKSCANSPAPLGKFFWGVVLGPHPVIFRGYSGLCMQESLQAVLKVTMLKSWVDCVQGERHTQQLCHCSGSLWAI